MNGRQSSVVSRLSLDANGSRALPDGWVWTTLGEATNPSQKRVNPQDYPDLPYVGMENVESQTMRLLGTVPANEMRSAADSFSPGDVLYGRLRPYLNKVISPDFAGLCSTEFIIFRKSENIQSKYLQYFLNSWDFVQFANSLNAGDRPRVKFEQLASHPFPLPPLPEQERIVARLEELLSDLDAGVAALERVRVGVKRYKASVLKAAFTGRLFGDRPDGLPEGWIWTTIGQITLPIEKVRPEGKPDVPFVYIDISSIDNSIQRIIEPKEYLGVDAPSRARQLVHSNDIVFSTVRTYLKNIALVPEKYDGQVASTGFSILRASDAILPKFLFYYTLTDEFLSPLNELQRGTSYPAIRDGDVRVQPVPLPPLEEQRRIVAEVERRLESARAVESAVEVGLKRAGRLRQAVLRSAFEGRLV